MLDGSRREVYEHFYIALEAASAGLGVAIGPIALVRDAVASGQLAAPFGFKADGTRYELLSPTPIEPGGPPARAHAVAARRDRDRVERRRLANAAFADSRCRDTHRLAR